MVKLKFIGEFMTFEDAKWYNKIPLITKYNLISTIDTAKYTASGRNYIYGILTLVVIFVVPAFPIYRNPIKLNR